MKSFGSYLKNLRNDQRLSLSDVHAQCGITNSRLSRAEREDGKPLTPAELKKLAGLYGISVVALYLEAGYLTDQDLINYTRVFDGADLLTKEEHESIQTQINLFIKGRVDSK